GASDPRSERRRTSKGRLPREDGSSVDEGLGGRLGSADPFDQTPSTREPVEAEAEAQLPRRRTDATRARAACAPPHGREQAPLGKERAVFARARSPRSGG